MSDVVSKNDTKSVKDKSSSGVASTHVNDKKLRSKESSSSKSVTGGKNVSTKSKKAIPPTPSTAVSSDAVASVGVADHVVSGVKQNDTPREPTLTDVMEFMTSMNTKVNEMYYGATGTNDFDNQADNESHDYNFEVEQYSEETDVFPLGQATPIEENNNEPPSKMAKINEEGTSIITSLFKTVSQKYKCQEKVGDKVDDDLAVMVNQLFGEGLQDEQYNDLIKSIQRPENCKSLQKTRVNQLIWNLLRPETRSDDAKIQVIQNTVVKAGANLTKLVNQLSKSETNGEHLIPLVTDSLALLGHANKLINNKRRESHKPDLGREYYHLSSPSLAYTDYLYGDELSKSVKEIQDINRVGKRLSGSFSYNNNRRFTRGGRGSFVRSDRGRGVRRGMERPRWSGGYNNQFHGQSKNSRPYRKESHTK